MDKYDADAPEHHDKPDVKKARDAGRVADKAGDRAVEAEYNGKKTKFGSKR